jgi:hypothetical protein
MILLSVEPAPNAMAQPDKVQDERLKKPTFGKECGPFLRLVILSTTWQDLRL